ncbi:hypothetical protein [Arthrobacter psychrochitiniphilus]|uniref:Uncharacterized protein n=1 Tax=Arthrobacter psychrochitiniphilus TaxID=291045 RepID=A0A2V3DMY1_9MICC|nr:hypothetical protein [Arthrobacter psychrochitiniphilus]NYG16039.1 hypothetical protein [Arthrobacter psychrochitiniphilus]PXA64011.1 hypothetical protein CVS29_17310 [Arthrobacter psychrochitiniphilus]
MPANSLTRIAWKALIIVVIFNAASAVGGSIAMLFTDGLGMPTSFLTNSPFTSFFLPALILLVVFGGTQTLAVGMLLRHRESSLFWTAIAGFAMIIWILTEIVIIQGFSGLQALYFTTGVLELALVLALLGIVSWLPRIEIAVGQKRGMLHDEV